MRLKFFIVLVLSLFPLIKVNAKCIKDIFAAGISFDSVKYNAHTESGTELATLASNLALGARVSWVIYCPKSQVELQPYLRLRQYSFSDIKAQESWGGVSDKSSLFSIGIEARKFKRILGKNFELMGEMELREELGFGINEPASTGDVPTIYSDKYLNFKAMSGLRYFAWHKGKMDITAVGKFGILKGLDSKSDMGIIYGVSGEYYQKLGKRTSGKIDLYLDHYSQGYGDLSMARTELGIRTNIVFRF